jgi:hypothetical protein
MAPFEDVPDRIDKFHHWNLGTYNSALQAWIAPAIEIHREIGFRRMGPIESLRVSPDVYSRKTELKRFVEGLDCVPG